MIYLSSQCPLIVRKGQQNSLNNMPVHQFNQQHEGHLKQHEKVNHFKTDLNWHIKHLSTLNKV